MQWHRINIFIPKWEGWGHSKAWSERSKTKTQTKPTSNPAASCLPSWGYGIIWAQKGLESPTQTASSSACGNSVFFLGLLSFMPWLSSADTPGVQASSIFPTGFTSQFHTMASQGLCIGASPLQHTGRSQCLLWHCGSRCPNTANLASSMHRGPTPHWWFCQILLPARDTAWPPWTTVASVFVR